MMIALSLCRAWQGDETASIHVSNIVGNVIVIPCLFFQLQSYGQWVLSISVHFWTVLNHLLYNNPSNSRILIGSRL